MALKLDAEFPLHAPAALCAVGTGAGAVGAVAVNHVHGCAAGGVLVAVPEVEPSGRYVLYLSVGHPAGVLAARVARLVLHLRAAVPHLHGAGIFAGFVPLAHAGILVRVKHGRAVGI